MSSSLSSSSFPFLIFPKTLHSTRKSIDTKPVAVLWQQTSSTSTSSEQQSISIPSASSSLSPSLRRNSSQSQQQSCCAVCQQHEARYCCPKCELEYCSVDCYRNHRETCTERFYQTRVHQVLELEGKERREDMIRMLNRVHHQRNQEEEEDENDYCAADMNGHADKKEAMSISQLDLYQLLQALENGNEQELDRILQKLPNIQTALNHAIYSGELQDWIFLEPWSPWWRPTLLTREDARKRDEDHNNEEEEEEEENDDIDASIESQAPTLDERLLNITCFSSLRPKTSRVILSEEEEGLPALEFNLVDLLYSLVLTLRLYHGLSNAQQPELALAAATTLMESSSVLSRDARFTTVAETLLSSVVGISVSSSTHATITSTTTSSTTSNHDHHTPWHVLALDVARLCQNRRMVARALFEAMDILQAAIAVLAKTKRKKKKQQQQAGSNNNNNKETIQKMRRMHKKLEFYLSWSREPSASIESLPNQIEAWVAEWQLNKEKGVDEMKIHPDL